MVKLVYCIRKRTEMSTESFRKYWLDVHGPLIREFSQALRAKRYVQSHTIEPAINALVMSTRGMSPPYDGVTELWWENTATFQSIFENTEALQSMHKRILEDESKFIDFPQSRAFLTEEHRIFDL